MTEYTRERNECAEYLENKQDELESKVDSYIRTQLINGQTCDWDLDFTILETQIKTTITLMEKMGYLKEGGVKFERKQCDNNLMIYHRCRSVVKYGFGY